MLGIPHPYLTASLPGVGGSIKERLEDFIVEEVPLYTPCDHGEHTYFEIEKTDLSTPEALERLSRLLRVPAREFGYAGLKDRKGITRQTLSVSKVKPEELSGLDVPQLRVLWARRHTNKLRVGHLRGNRFRIWIRGIDPGQSGLVGEILGVLERRGAPNFYGPQRFGNRGDAHRVGRAFLKRDDRAAIRRILGHPSPTEHNPHVVEARNLFMAGDLKGALIAFPSSYREERRILHYLLGAADNYAGARRTLADTSRKLYYTAYQSFLFNVCLAKRLERTGGDLAQVVAGDLAYLHRNGAVFAVLDADSAAPRSEAFEISPSGPIFGMKMPYPTGLEGEIESWILASERLQPTDFHQLMQHMHLEGGRRPYRVKVEDLGWRLDGRDVAIEFFLPKGSYATTVLREITKTEAVPEAFYCDGDEERLGLWRPPTAPAGGRPSELPAEE